MTRTLQIPTARVFRPLLEPARYKAAHGGRGSGKSHFFGELLVEECLAEKGTLAVCIREVQKTLAQSSKRLIETKIRDLGVQSEFKVFNEKIQTPGDGIIIFNGMQEHTAESIKSLEGFRIADIEEGQTLSARSLALLRPTIRSEGSQIWCRWNPRRKTDAVDDFFRAKQPGNAIVVRANWRDNPFWTKELEAERVLDLRLYPERYEHIWEGDYAKAFEGAYFAKGLAEAKAQNRIGAVVADPLMRKRAFFDIGGSGAKADAMAIWIAQFVGQQILVLDYIEGVGQVLAYYVDELRKRGYQNALCYLPHDGVNENNITGKKYRDHLEEADFEVEVIENQGKGAAMMRVEAVRRILSRCWFNEATTEAGRDALGYYHERKDEERGVGLGPDHDWSSHCFVGETKVLTRYGMRQIKNLPYQGDILTPCGWRAYRNPRMTRRNAPVVEVRFADGYSVKCTPDHLFATESGWKSAESLTQGLPILSGLTLSRRISMVAYTAAGRVTDIGRAAVRNYTAMFGLVHSALYQMGVTFITGTTIPTITCLPISNVYRQPSIFRRIGGEPKAVTSLGNISAPMRANSQQIGTHRQRGDYGTGGTLNVQSHGQNGSESHATVLSAASNLTRSFARVVMRKFTAPAFARSLRIESVRRLGETRDVWCLTVPGDECFSLANGAVVHNCADAFGLMAICYEPPSTTIKPQGGVHATQGGWMGG